MDYLDKAEERDLVSRGGGNGALTRSVFVYRTWDGRLFLSYVYRYEHLLNAIRTMSTVAVNGDLFYLGYGKEVQDGSEETRQLQVGEDPSGKALGPTDVSETSLVYGLVNLAAYHAQAMTESIIHDACEERNVNHLPNDNLDGIGLDDGKDVHRFPISKPCGQHGRSYDEETSPSGESRYDCTTQINGEEFANMEARAISRGHWAGVPGSFYCGSRDVHGTTGFWDAMVGREVDKVDPTPKGIGKMDVEGCCWWGRGSLSIKGTCIYGKLNYHLGKNKADRKGAKNAMFPDVDFCRDPGKICTGADSVPLRWISGMYGWIERVQKYKINGYRYMDELTRYVNEDLVNTKFFSAATDIHVLGCHEEGSCANGRTVEDYNARLRAFEKVLSLLGLQFGSHADLEPPFKAFPGQHQPTPPPAIVAPVDSRPSRRPQPRPT
ncbi:hypothetical protein ACHAWF_014540 [Thalassiosira exigua]